MPHRAARARSNYQHLPRTLRFSHVPQSQPPRNFREIVRCKTAARRDVTRRRESRRSIVREGRTCPNSRDPRTCNCNLTARNCGSGNFWFVKMLSAKWQFASRPVRRSTVEQNRGRSLTAGRGRDCTLQELQSANGRCTTDTPRQDNMPVIPVILLAFNAPIGLFIRENVGKSCAASHTIA